MLYASLTHTFALRVCIYLFGFFPIFSFLFPSFPLLLFFSLNLYPNYNCIILIILPILSTVLTKLSAHYCCLLLL